MFMNNIESELKVRMECLKMRRQTVFTNRAILDREQELIEEEMQYIDGLIDDLKKMDGNNDNTRIS